MITFERLLKGSSDKIRQAGCGMPAVLIRQLDNLGELLAVTPEGPWHDRVRAHARLVLTTAEEAVTNEFDLTDIRAALLACVAYDPETTSRSSPSSAMTPRRAGDRRPRRRGGLGCGPTVPPRPGRARWRRPSRKNFRTSEPRVRAERAGRLGQPTGTEDQEHDVAQPAGRHGTGNDGYATIGPEPARPGPRRRHAATAVLSGTVSSHATGSGRARADAGPKDDPDAAGSRLRRIEEGPPHVGR